MQPWTEEECKIFEAGVVHVVMKHMILLYMVVASDTDFHVLLF